MKLNVRPRNARTTPTKSTINIASAKLGVVRIFVLFLGSDNSHTTSRKIPPDEECLLWGWCVVRSPLKCLTLIRKMQTLCMQPQIRISITGCSMRFCQDDQTTPFASTWCDDEAGPPKELYVCGYNARWDSDSVFHLQNQMSRVVWNVRSDLTNTLNL